MVQGNPDLTSTNTIQKMNVVHDFVESTWYGRWMLVEGTWSNTIEPWSRDRLQGLGPVVIRPPPHGHHTLCSVIRPPPK